MSTIPLRVNQNHGLIKLFHFIKEVTTYVPVKKVIVGCINGYLSHWC